MGTEKGVKLDNGKIRLGLVLGGFAKGLKEVGCIGTFGANKYCDNGWQTVDNGVKRYTDALFRHLFAWLEGDEIDAESGYRHLAHAAWNCLALLTLTHMSKFLLPKSQWGCDDISKFEQNKDMIWKELQERNNRATNSLGKDSQKSWQKQ